MKPEDVPAELVEKAYRARADYMRGETIGDIDWQAVWSTIEADGMRHALAAVWDDIAVEGLNRNAPRVFRHAQAMALRDAADVVKAYTGRLESADGSVSLIEAVIRQRAARLTDTTEEPTT